MREENHESVSATELARNLSAVIDKVRISGRSLSITKGSQTVAELRPPSKPGYPAEKLAALLNSLPRLDNEADSMAKDLTRIRQSAQLPENPWD